MRQQKNRTAGSDDFVILVPLFLAVITLGLFASNVLAS